MSGNGLFLDKDLLRSIAFRSLSKWSLLVYLDFLRMRVLKPISKPGRQKEYTIENNGKLVYTYETAERKGIGRREFRKAIVDLVEGGFIDFAHVGSGGKRGDTNLFEISERWKSYGTPDFKPPKVQIKKDSRSGIGWSSYHEKLKNR
jgi:hypothetical protein